MISTVLMMIGPYPFSLNTAAYDGLQRSAAWRWRAQPRVGRTPARQFLGPDAETITLSGTILPEFRGGHAQMEEMRAAADQGAPLLLVDGRGYVWGEFVIAKVDERQSVFHSDGPPRKIDFTMTLETYGADDQPSRAYATGEAAERAQAERFERGGL